MANAKRPSELFISYWHSESEEWNHELAEKNFWRIVFLTGAKKLEKFGRNLAQLRVFFAEPRLRFRGHPRTHAFAQAPSMDIDSKNISSNQMLTRRRLTAREALRRAQERTRIDSPHALSRPHFPDPT